MGELLAVAAPEAARLVSVEAAQDGGGDEWLPRRRPHRPACLS